MKKRKRRENREGERKKRGERKKKRRKRGVRERRGREKDFTDDMQEIIASMR